MINRILTLVVAVAFIAGQCAIAEAAFTTDKIYTNDTGNANRISDAFTASADLVTGITDVADLSASLKNIAGDADASEVSFSANFGDRYVKGAQYLKVNYDANQSGWGVQMYTDNKGTTMPTAVAYPGDPETNMGQQPAGLIGQSNPYLTCPMVILTTANKIADPNTELDVPVETDTTTLLIPINPGQPGYGIWFEVGYDDKPGGTADEKVWRWLKDLKSTDWPVDTNGDSLANPSELVLSFNSPTGYPGADDYSTIVQSLGIASGWVDAVSKDMLRDFELGTKDPTDGYTLYVYFAADFKTAREKQIYKTETMTLELYHQ
ncbi:MAG: hypothetical protein ISS34_05000 [Candidatus Omnitrophica bacterium]|nr:hypothetical protein [Candidatus Omnitrophota bacterium]